MTTPTTLGTSSSWHLGTHRTPSAVYRSNAFSGGVWPGEGVQINDDGAGDFFCNR